MLFWRRLPHDLGFAIRRLAKSPGFTLVCLLTLSLGIGSTTAVFTLVQQVLLKSLPVPHPAELYRIGDGDDCCVNTGLQGSHSLFSYDLYRHLRDNLPDFTDRLYVIERGEIIFAGKPAEARRNKAVARVIEGTGLA